MKLLWSTAAALAISAGGAHAGAIERSTQSVGILFEEGRYGEFSLSFVSPSVSGTLGGTPSGDMAPSYLTYSFGYKQDLSDNLALALILDQPIGADVSYPAGGYLFAGSNAELRSNALTGLLKYRFPSNVSVYGGVRVMRTEGTVSIPFLGGYTLDADPAVDVGYVVGVAYERPDIALRVALTYNSAIDQDFDVTEFGAATSVMPVEIPQSVNLEFQTGIAEDTLLFGSIRWVDWTAFELDPAAYPPATPLVSYANDVTTYTIGVGRRFNEQWSGAVTIGYEKHHGDPVGNLGPTDGQTSLGLGATYTQGNVEISGGVRYIWVGDAMTTAGAQFDGNDAIAAGVRVGVKF